MKKFKLFIILNLFLFSLSCTTMKDGFTGNKKNSNDEFLVEKKSPLIMPPNYNELPVPITSKTKIKILIMNSENKNISQDSEESINKNFEELLLEKIKQN